jgi:hypothetical protein
VIDQGSGPLDDLRLHAIPDRLLTDKFVEIPWRGLERVEGIMFAQPLPSHDLDEIAHLNHMVENDDGRTRHTASGSSQAIMHATVQQQALGPRDQMVSQIVSEPSLTTSGSGMFDRQALNAQIRLKWRDTGSTKAGLRPGGDRRSTRVYISRNDSSVRKRPGLDDI